MTAPDAGYTDTDVERAIFRKLRQTFHNPPWAGHASVDADCHMCHTAARAALSALAATGRLLPADAKPREQWAVRKSCALEGESVGLPMRTREDAEREVAYLGRIDATRSTYGVRGEVVRREVRNFPDGSTWVGPWLPAPTDTEESA